MATTKKTTAVKKTATAAAKKAVKTVAAKVADAAVTTAVTKAKATTKKVAGKKQHVFIFFNCNDNKDAHSMNARYNNEDRQHYTIPNQRPKDKHCGKI